MLRSAALAILFSTSLVAQAADAPAADPAKGQAIASTVCAGCHGAEGTSPAPTFPHLAGQIPEYIAKQLSNFKPGADGKPAQRNNPIMMGMTAALSEEDMRNLGAFYGSKKLNLPAAETDAKLLAAGKKLWISGDIQRAIPACAACHGAKGAGLPAQYPQLAGQFSDYTEAQLKAFRAGDRSNDPEKMMRTIAARMSDADIKAVAVFAASLR